MSKAEKKANTNKSTKAECCSLTEKNLEKLLKGIPSLDVLSDLADVYKIFGDSTRLSILSALRMHEFCVNDLATILQMTSSAISHQLRNLRQNNLVRFRRQGKMIFYSLADEHVEAIIDMGLEHMTELNT